ncbi:tRNA preQ1(34) S-adenosylmethionine ribosyltransferase-isomerase QueA [Myxococcota bacterium]|nr:tRNA preQ1(34) S-adenosylmethionine ribosyltransferase-isomerase QueA [Myxococcota bacterium]
MAPARLSPPGADPAPRCGAAGGVVAEEGALTDLDYTLPEALIARHPPVERDGGRLLVVGPDERRDARVVDLPGLLRAGDLLVVNDTRVVPARLYGRRASGGRVEALLLPHTQVPVLPGGPDAGEPLLAMLRPGRRLAPGEVLAVEGGGQLALVAREEDGTWRVQARPSAQALMEAGGHVPLPPYLARPDDAADRERYQTVYAGPPGAVAAPTAGLHLSEGLLERLAAAGVERATVTLHVGAGTFRPLRPEDLAQGRLHAEPWWLPEETAAAVDRARARGGRVVAVGTTSTRVLEAAATGQEGRVRAGQGWTDLFLRPGSRFQVVDRLLTNLHLPGSSLLALVQAFAGIPRVRAAYDHAVAAGYRFYSYGDAMLLDLSPPGRLPEPRR